MSDTISKTMGLPVLYNHLQSLFALAFSFSISGVFWHYIMWANYNSIITAVLDRRLTTISSLCCCLCYVSEFVIEV